MNDPNKRIEVNLSSLLSLKAELLRKQQEVNKTNKPNTSDPFKVFNPRGANSKRKIGDKIKSKNEDGQLESTAPKVTNEEVEMLAKSKRILEAKTKLYDRMTANGGALNSDDRCLVRFNQKKQDDRQNKPPESSSSESDNDREDSIVNDDQQEDDDRWTEYIDCLGRTRKCLKEDLAFFKRKDQDLAQVARERIIANEEKPSQGWFVDTKGISSADLPLYKASTTRIDDDSLSMISKSTKAEEMRQQWQQKEQDNINRDELHYQDVLFNEARTHGVGFYAFSSDKSERLKQQHALETEREKTLESQKKRDHIRLNREKILADRIFAAKNRQRARLGLPPLDQEEINKAKEEKKSEESKEEWKRKKKEEIERLKKEELDRKREEKRKQHIRKWDQGKDGVSRRKVVSSDSDSDEWEYKPEKLEPMSQEQWNEMKRAERNKEFAPPNSSFDQTPSSIIETNSFNRFTSIKPKAFKRRNAEPVANMFNEPIRNELDGNDFPVDDDRSEDRSKRHGAEIAPPSTFDYYGPTSSNQLKTHKPPNDITSSIDAGLRFLREKSDKGILGTKQSWVTNTTYEQQ